MVQTAPGDPVTVWRNRLAADRDDAYWLENTRSLIEQARTRQAVDLRDDMKNYVYWVDVSASHPEHVDASVLSEFIEQFARLAANLGEPGDVGVVTALDRAIGLCAVADRPTTQLYLAKAAYFGSLHTESDKRYEALTAALASTVPGSSSWADVMLALCWYRIEISRYDLALALVEKLRAGLAPDLLSAKYECGALAYAGAAMFSSFQDLTGAAKALRLACDYENRIGDDEDIGRWVATAYHYSGRLAEIRRFYASALVDYLKGKEIHERCPDDLFSLGCVHLRIAELLISARRRVEAYDHLNHANALFRTCSNQSTGRLQVDLAYATLDAANRRFDDSFATIYEARERAQNLGFWRGELLCLGYLLALCIRIGHIGRIPRILVDIIGTARRGELSRNSLRRLLAKLPVILPVVTRRMFQGRYRRPYSDEEIDKCPCGLHTTDDQGSLQR
jgi:hypothetical protein